MRRVLKKTVRLQAWQLGSGSDKEKELIRQGKIVPLPDGSYELFSQEAVHGEGEKAQAGDFFKVDSLDSPYPNPKEQFLKTHVHLKEDWYEQISNPLSAWFAGDPMCKEVQFLIKEKGLVLKPEQPECYFNAPLWGAPLSSPYDSALMFYAIKKDAEGNILDAEFNFVARADFEQTYVILDPEDETQSCRNKQK